jgi:hypothetical protein
LTSFANNNPRTIRTNKPNVRRKKVFWNPVGAKEGTVWSVLKRIDVKLKHCDDFDVLFSQAIGEDNYYVELKETSQPPSNSPRSVKVIE